jgi:hypothetical protein
MAKTLGGVVWKIFSKNINLFVDLLVLRDTSFELQETR